MFVYRELDKYDHKIKPAFADRCNAAVDTLLESSQPMQVRGQKIRGSGKTLVTNASVLFNSIK